MYDNPHMDSYLSDEQDGVDLGGGHLGSIHAFGGHMGLGDDLDSDEKALLGTGKRKVGMLCFAQRHLGLLPVVARSACWLRNARKAWHPAAHHCPTTDLYWEGNCVQLASMRNQRSSQTHWSLMWLWQGGYAKSVDSYGGYASEMNPKLKGKKVPQLPKEPVEEYIPPPFNANAPQARKGLSIKCHQCMATLRL